jgi:hypothetical protein
LGHEVIAFGIALTTIADGDSQLSPS